MEGRGTYRYADGAMYDGEYKADKKEGRGTYHFADGTVEVSIHGSHSARTPTAFRALFSL